MAFKPIINLFSVLVMLFSISLLAPLGISFFFEDGVEYIFLTTFVAAFIPALLAWSITRKSNEEMGTKDGFVIITLSSGLFFHLSVLCRLYYQACHLLTPFLSQCLE